MYGYGDLDEMKKVLHEWTGTGVRDISDKPLKNDKIFTLTDRKENKKYLGCVRSEWDKIQDTIEPKPSDGEYKIEGIRCKFAYGPGDYVILTVI